MKKVIFALVVFFLFAGCQADELEIEISRDQILNAASGSLEAVEFEAVFSNYGELDQDDRAEVDRLEGILERYLTVNDFEIDLTSNGYEITIEGEIPLSSDADNTSAFFVHVGPSVQIEDALLVQFSTGRSFDGMEQEMQSVNFMLAPDKVHPTQFRLNADGLEVIAPAVQVDGEYHLLWRGVVADRVRMIFSGGVFENIGAGFFVREPLSD